MRTLTATKTRPAIGADHFITVDGVRLHYLDWSGDGPTLLFLTGLGNSAWIYDDLAPRFTDRFRVLGLTRRGHGRSEKPETGYDTDTLVEDIRAFLDALQIERVSMVGHSLAGDELTRFVTMYPERIDRLVYLDAAVDRSTLPEILGQLPVAQPQPTAEDLASWDAFRAWATRFFGRWSETIERDFRESTVIAEDGTVKDGMPDAVGEALMQGTVASAPDFRKITVPVLSFHAFPNELFPMPEETDEATRQRVRDWADTLYLPFARQQVERFRREVPHGRIVEMPGTHHYCFIDQPESVYAEMRAFLLDEDE